MLAAKRFNCACVKLGNVGVRGIGKAAGESPAVGNRPVDFKMASLNFVIFKGGEEVAVEAVAARCCGSTNEVMSGG